MCGLRLCAELPLRHLQFDTFHSRDSSLASLACLSFGVPNFAGRSFGSVSVNVAVSRDRPLTSTQLDGH
jgi:hypothetical protein